jgi:hypothetical protein
VLDLQLVEVARLRQTFLHAYHEADGPQLNEGTLRMFGARSVLNKLLQMGDAVSAVMVDPEGMRTDPEVVEGTGRDPVDELREEIELLRRALGWEE